MTRRVAILCEFSTLNGGENSLLSVLPQVLADNWTPVVFCPASGALSAKLHQCGIDVEPLEMRAANATDARATIRTELARRLRRLAPALVHANSLSMGRLAGPVVAELGIPSISHLRDIVTLSRAAVAELNQHRRLLAVSAATRAAHLRQGLCAERTIVLYNGVNLNEFHPGVAEGWLHQELGVAPDAMLVGCIGQVSLRKGQDTLAAAATLLADRWPQLHYVFVGARHSDKAETLQFETDLHARFAVANLPGQGHFLGLREDVSRILRELTLYVHPARQEPLGRVLLEAGASGCAIAATHVGGTPEIFPPECGGAVLVPPDDATALAVAMASLSSNSRRRSELAAQARQRIVDAFDANRSAEGLLRHYNEVAGA